jgi:hypothetical protein
VANTAANVTSWTNTGLANSTGYTYRVCAFNTYGKSAYSNTASATTTAPPPAAPGTPSVTPPAPYTPPVIVMLDPGQTVLLMARATPPATPTEPES